MDHAEVLERLDEAFVARGKIWSIEHDPGVGAALVREHLDACAPCRDEYHALTVTASALAVGAPEGLAAPAGARERLLERVREVGVPRGAAARAGGTPTSVTPRLIDRQGARPTALRTASPSRRRSVRAGLAVAASIALLVIGGALGRTLLPVTDRSPDDVGRLAALAATVSDLLADPGHRQERLASTSARDGGTVIVSGDGRRLAVVSNAIATPPPDTSYDCYLERDGQRTLVGWMHFAEGVAYWAGPIRAEGTIGRAGDRFLVIQRRPGATPELSATF